MKKVARYSVYIVLVALFCFGTAYLALKSQMDYSMATCNSISIEFADSLKFVTEGEVRSCIRKSCGDVVGQRLDSVKLYSIEEALEKSSAIMGSEAWTTPDGVLHVRINQRTPVLRFIDGDNGFYVDAEGFIFPLHSGYTAPVPTVEGPAPVHFAPGYKGMAQTESERRWIASMLDMISYISGSRSWRDNVTGIFLSKDGDIMLSLSRGNEKFIFGGSNNYLDKFAKIKQYYDIIVPKVGENYYKIVNLKYNQQIICRQIDT